MGRKSLIFNTFRLFELLRIRSTNWFGRGGWPISSRSASRIFSGGGFAPATVFACAPLLQLAPPGFGSIPPSACGMRDPDATMSATTEDRVRKNTATHINRMIDGQLEASVHFFARAGPETIARRLEELDCEWDLERVLEANASTLALTGTMCSAF